MGNSEKPTGILKKEMEAIVTESDSIKLGGFGTYILAMGSKAAEGDASGESNIVDPSVARLIPFLLLVSLSGILILMPFRKIMIIRHKLIFPSGTATANLINSFHTPHGANHARFYFDFSMTNVGIGMICPHMITVSIVIGAILSWGIIVPYLNSKEGIWYAANLNSNSFAGIGGYKVFIGVSMMLAEALFNFLCIMIRTLCVMYKQHRQPMQRDGGANAQLPFKCLDATEQQQAAVKCFDDRRRAQVFLRDQIPDSIIIACYVFLSMVSLVVIPSLYPQLRSYHVAIIFSALPFFAFCNVYGLGMTDMNLSSTYGKLAMLIFGSCVGINYGGVITGLVACGVVMGSMSNGGDLMQDLKTGYMTLTSPRVIFISKVIGTTLGCIINPVIFWVFYKAKLGNVDLSDVPYAKVYRGIAMLSAGQDDLPIYSMHISGLFFALALALSIVREVARLKQWRVASYIPNTVAIAVAFFLPPRVVIDMFVGSVILYLWECIDTNRARTFSSAVASGLICGDGLGSLLSSAMAITHTQAPICIKFLSRSDNLKLDAFLATLT
ncbi:hypothetical protein PR202_ga06246 [Eleusine coracana subsp. coracana]|uniref:Metal-nicotianamine transporter YSL7 n=1 Tax=Eleusine coracana subsp. coracana TaxID=191504 RepID=A0AAV5BW83_ELECO|nr:hypothetical protein PR202_ga06246 [Eleusine coracana subsp. coracana]